MKPILPKGSVSIKLPVDTVHTRRNLIPPTATILLIHSQRSAIKVSNENTHRQVQKNQQITNSVCENSDKQLGTFPSSTFNLLSVVNEGTAVGDIEHGCNPSRKPTRSSEAETKTSFEGPDNPRNKTITLKSSSHADKLSNQLLLRKTESGMKLEYCNPELKISSTEDKRLSCGNKTSHNGIKNKHRTDYLNDFHHVNYSVSNAGVHLDRNAKFSENVQKVMSDIANSLGKNKSNDIDIHSSDNNSYNYIQQSTAHTNVTVNPPSYEAHICKSSLTKNESQCSASLCIPYDENSSYFTKHVENEGKVYPPPYFQCPSDRINPTGSSSPYYPVTAGTSLSYDPDDLSSQSLSYSNYQLIQNYSANKHAVEGDGSNEAVTNCVDVKRSSNCDTERYSNNSDSYDISYCYDTEEPKDYSSNADHGISLLKKREIEAIKYVKTFTENASFIISQCSKEHESYRERRQQANSILNIPEESSVRRKKSLAENFWIVEDEPLDNTCFKRSADDQSVHEISAIPDRSKKKTSVSKREFVCHICGNVLTGRNSFSCHLNRHIKGKSYKCQFCSRKFAHICSLKYHSRTHTNENPYVCKICSKSFKALSNLNKHKLVHSQARAYKCEICNKLFKTKFRMEVHVKIHIIQSHTCKVCHSVYESRKALTTHIRRKHKEHKLFACPECKKSYQYQCLLKQHIKVHFDDRSYCCHLCGASFVWRSGLASHMKTHSFKLQCEICSSKFTSLKKLDKHRRQHSDPFPHKCDRCKKEFKYAYLLKNHVTRHKDDLLCSVCQLGFVTKSKLRKHLKIHDEVTPLPF